MSAMWLRWLASGTGRAMRDLQRADAARDARDWAAAGQSYAAYLTVKPDDWGVRVQLGHALKEAGNLPGAEAAYRDAAASAPEDADVLLHLGHLLKTMGRQSEAEVVFRRCAELLERTPHTPRADEMRRAVDDATRPSFRMLGDAARDARNWLEASRHYRAHLEAEAADGAIWVQLGNVSKEARQFGPAEAAYRHAMLLNPAQPEACLQLGHLLKLLDRLDEAREAFRLAAELGGGTEAVREFSALGAWGRGAASGMGSSEGQGHHGARPFAPDIRGPSERPAEVLTGDDLRALLNAQAARDRRSWDVASALYGTYLAAVPSDPGVWLEYATVLRESGRYQKAYDATIRAGVNGPASVDLMREKVRLLRHLGRHSQAEALSTQLMMEHGFAAGNME